ncbi:MAG: penicillin-binding protein 1C [Bradyrhizobium sp.]|uniref:penicillin-binding protein 1C n=1 Tax=Bradyrhizobium sp. TaxID=376 RepID=UPI0025C3453C|nr:penicillin-binding protein 1C [Bradyrhizobium sp.]MBI5261720.1 penicillin-binding protein 1C [Bradyrhizobium sp.]
MSEAAPHTRSSCPGLTRASTKLRAAGKDVDGRVKPGHDGGVKSRAGRIFLIAAATLFIVASASFTAWVVSLGPLPLDKAREVSATVVDRNGRLLRAYAMADGRWRLPVDARGGVDPTYIKLLLAYEDQRFHSHHGVDPLALGRAALQLISRGRIVSGGSTITMQLARLMEPRRQRSLYAKLRQMVRAIELERELSKDQILDLYLALAPYGGNLEGIRAASLGYFGKEPKRLSLAEAALLVALPQSPETRRLDRYPDAARAARDRVLDRMVEELLVSAEDAAQAKAAPVPRLRKPMPILAPHSADQAITTMKDLPVVRLTLDAGLQRVLEPLARDRAIALGPNISVAIIAVDNESGDVLARIGSADYFDHARAGQVDMTRAVRSPGSTLKPFIYGLAFEDGLVHPESLIDDRPIRFGSYAPENFDMTFQGTVPVRKALQLSLNVPAIALLDRVGSSRLTSRLRQGGVNLVLPKDEAPGLAMGLGGVGITLQDLAQLYAGLARLGTTRPLHEIVTDKDDQRDPLRLLDQVAAWQVGNVLLGTPPPENAPHNRIAFKTGTSYGYRDAWSVGFDGRMTIGVWVGRPDGAPVPGLIGRTAAAPILFDAFARTGKLPAPLSKAPKGTLAASNAKLPLPLRRFRPVGELVRSGGEQAPHIQFPLNGSRIDVDRTAGGASAMPVKVAGGVLPMTVLVNGMAVGEIDGRRQRLIDPPGPGFARLTVIDAKGTADTVVIRIQ